MTENENDKNGVITPEPPQVMDPSRPPASQQKEKKDGSGKPREKGKKREGQEKKPKLL